MHNVDACDRSVTSFAYLVWNAMEKLKAGWLGCASALSGLYATCATPLLTVSASAAYVHPRRLRQHPCSSWSRLPLRQHHTPNLPPLFWWAGYWCKDLHHWASWNHHAHENSLRLDAKSCSLHTHSKCSELAVHTKSTVSGSRSLDSFAKFSIDKMRMSSYSLNRHI